MGSKSPPVPDYKGIAEQTAKSNAGAAAAQTTADRVNQIGPGGQVTYSRHLDTDPATGAQTTAWTQRTDLSPELKQAYDSQVAVQGGRSAIAENLLPQVKDAYSQGIDYSKFTPMSFGGAPQYTAANKAPTPTNTQAITQPFAMGPQSQNIDTSRQAVPTLNTNLGANAGQGIAKNLNYQGLANVDNANDQRQAAFNNLYSQATSRLDPQWQQRQTQLETQLANQGITQGSEAYNQAMQQNAQGRNDAYNQALMSAQSGAGQQAQINYNMQMGIHQQGAQEAQNQGAFQNQAQQQGFTEGMQAGVANNDAQGQAFGFGNTARGTQVNAQNARYNQDLAGSTLGLSREGQAFTQGLNANNQNFNQGMQAGQQDYSQNLGANAQNFSMAQNAAGFQNTNRQQEIIEAQQRQGWSLDAINKLMNNQAVNPNPQFPNYMGAAGTSGTDFTGAAKNTNMAQIAASDATNAQNAQYTQAATGALAAYAMYAGMAASDRAVKADVRRIGRDRRGFGIYRYRYIGERGTRVGVLAQEVRRVMPGAVVRNPAGWLMVNYAALGNVQ